jgi:hypothetical protein
MAERHGIKGNQRSAISNQKRQKQRNRRRKTRSKPQSDGHTPVLEHRRGPNHPIALIRRQKRWLHLKLNSPLPGRKADKEALSTQ